MGGTPLTALSIVCYPQKGDWEVLGKILLGGQMAMNEAGVPVIGGHSVDDQEMKFGYAVTGIVHPDNILTNAGARPGDVLILTKPIGTGAINTAVKRGTARPETVAAAISAMTTSAAAASKAMKRLNVRGCTDVTGFGLLGHAFEMAKASDVTLNVDSKAVPLLPDVLELIADGMLTRGDKNNRVYVGDTVSISAAVSKEMQSALFDPQTAGGLLISIAADTADEYLAAVPGSAAIGTVVSRGEHLIEVK
jgi:selenide,water dikinase